MTVIPIDEGARINRMRNRRFHIFRMREKHDRAEEKLISLWGQGVHNSKLNAECLELRELIKALEDQFVTMYGEEA